MEDILVALGGENLVDAREVPSGRRLVAPQRQHLRQSRRNMRGIALRQPIGFGATAEHIMQLEKLDDSVPAIAEKLVEPIGVNRHSGAARAEERRGGKECGSTCRSRGAPHPDKKKDRKKTK